jgi:hypothetical protein
MIPITCRPPSRPWARSGNRPLRGILAVLCLAGLGAGCDVSADPVDPPNGATDPPRSFPPLIWPLATTDSVDADSVHSPYGPRWIGRYDFHAGIDLPAARGTPVHAVMTGTVAQVRTWDGSSTGAGNAVLVHHAAGVSTSYLHLHDMRVKEGQVVHVGDVIGTVGSTGATYPHLHFGYMQGLGGNSVDERRSRNPLELLPHSRPSDLGAITFDDPATVTLTVPLQSMTIASITLQGDSLERAVDYYAIVGRGFEPRKDPVQNGVRIQAGSPQGGEFELTLRLEPADFVVRGVVVVDIHGARLAEQARPD